MPLTTRPTTAMADTTIPFYSTSDAAALTGVSTSTLVEYEKCGLIKPARSSRGIRLYSAADLAAIKQIYAARVARKGKTGIRSKIAVAI